jgi:hypothetical protein
MRIISRRRWHRAALVDTGLRQDVEYRRALMTEFTGDVGGAGHRALTSEQVIVDAAQDIGAAIRD